MALVYLDSDIKYNSFVYYSTNCVMLLFMAVSSQHNILFTNILLNELDDKQ